MNDRWDDVPVSIIAEAEKAWKMLRIASESVRRRRRRGRRRR